MADLRDILGKNLALFRKERGWTQEQLAELSDTSKGYVAFIETGRRWPSDEILEKLAAALEIPAVRLFFAPETLSLDTALATVLDSLGYEPTIPARKRRRR